MTTINLTTGDDQYFNSNTDGSNSIEGGAGDDLFGLSGTYGTDNDTINGGDGIDTVVLHTVDSNAPIDGIVQTGEDLFFGTPYFSVYMNNGAAKISYASFIDYEVGLNSTLYTYSYSLSNIENIWTNTSSASNIINMVSSDNVERSIYGGDGSDTIDFKNFGWSINSSGQLQTLTSTARHNIWGYGGNDHISVTGFVVVTGVVVMTRLRRVVCCRVVLSQGGMAMTRFVPAITMSWYLAAMATTSSLRIIPLVCTVLR